MLSTRYILCYFLYYENKHRNNFSDLKLLSCKQITRVTHVAIRYPFFSDSCYPTIRVRRRNCFTVNILRLRRRASQIHIFTADLNTIKVNKERLLPADPGRRINQVTTWHYGSIHCLHHCVTVLCPPSLHPLTRINYQKACKESGKYFLSLHKSAVIAYYVCLPSCSLLYDMNNRNKS